MKKAFLILFTLFFSYFVNAQEGYRVGYSGDMPADGIIKGQVVDSKTNLVVPFATVAVFKLQDSSVVAGVISDEGGNFIITNLRYGKYYLTADFIGYYKKTISDIKIFPKAKEYDCGIIKLKQVDQDIEGVEVLGENSAVQYKIDRKVINVSKNINASGGTLVDVLENTPSINVDIDGNVTMRGSSNFTVLIDGKPSVLDASDVLNQIPASTVERIEIITNPSAKYDPDGTSGIINIITKKKETSGISGIINASIGTGDKYSSDILMSYKTKKINFYVGGEYGKRTHSHSGNSLRETYMTDTTEFLSSSSMTNHSRLSYSGKLGLDIYLNDKNTISLEGKYGIFEFNRNLLSENELHTLPITTDYYTNSEGYFSIGGPYYKSSIQFAHNFKKEGHKIDFYGEYSERIGGNENDNIESEVDLDGNIIGNETKIRTFQDRGHGEYEFSSDYVYPINENSKFEAGIKSEMMSAGGDYRYEEYNTVTNLWENNTDYSNNLEFIRDIYSAYTTYSNKTFGFEYMLGLRGEYTYRLIDQQTTNEKYLVDKFNYFPSVHISRELPKEQQILLSYSRRINRPRHWYLNPFPSFSDSYSTRKGNPALQPEYTDSYEINYQNSIKKTVISGGLYYRQTNNEINRIQSIQDDGILLSTFDNTGKSGAYGTELSLNSQFAKWWKLFANFNFYQYNIKGSVAGEDVNNKSTNYDFKLNSTFIFSKKSRLQVNGLYYAPTVTAQGSRKSIYMVNFAYRQDFFKRKVSMVFRIRDPFQTAKFAGTSYGINFNSSYVFYREAPVFTLKLNYKINNYKQEKKNHDDNVNDEGAM